jgi:hypothetical protein
VPKVYIVNRGPHDYSEAKAFGELVYCTDGSVDKFDLSQMYRELDTAMLSSEANDYILLTSLTSLCSVACSLFVAKHGQLHVLIHRGDCYVERSLFFDN